MLVDDDTEIPENMVFDESFFQDDRVAGVGWARDVTFVDTDMILDGLSGNLCDVWLFLAFWWTGNHRFSFGISKVKEHNLLTRIVNYQLNMPRGQNLMHSNNPRSVSPIVHLLQVEFGQYRGGLLYALTGTNHHLAGTMGLYRFLGASRRYGSLSMFPMLGCWSVDLEMPKCHCEGLMTLRRFFCRCHDYSTD